MDMNKPNFAALKGSAASLSDKLQSKLREDNSGKQEDERFWKASRDKAGNGYAVIRFLPPAPNPECPNGVEDCFYVRIFSHAFQSKNGQWYIENSRTTIGQDDPVGEYNSELWGSGSEAGKEQARKQKRKTTFISNILVIEDPANPANEGKVFLFKYGKKIFEMISDRMNPQFPGDKKFNPFDFWEGANFKLKIREVEKFPNYDKSEFDTPSPLFDDDAKLEALWKKQYPLLPLIDASNFKSYDELQKKLHRVLGLSSPPSVPPRRDDTGADDNDEVIEEDSPRASAPAPARTAPSAPPEDEDELAFFKRVSGKN